MSSYDVPELEQVKAALDETFAAFRVLVDVVSALGPVDLLPPISDALHDLTRVSGRLCHHLIVDRNRNGATIAP